MKAAIFAAAANDTAMRDTAQKNTGMKPRTKPFELRRDDILQAARLLFIAKGITATTIEQIAQQADVAKGTFYLYFSSKEQVVAALREAYVAQFVAQLDSAVAGVEAGDWRGKLSAWTKATVYAYLEDVPLHDVVFHDPSQSYRAPQKDENPVASRLAEIFIAGNRAGAWRIDDPNFAAVFVFFGMHGSIDEVIAKEPKVNRSRLAKRIERMCLRVVGEQ